MMAYYYGLTCLECASCEGRPQFVLLVAVLLSETATNALAKDARAHLYTAFVQS